MRNKMKLVLILSLLMAFLSNALYPLAVAADPPNAGSALNKTPDDNATSWMYYRGLSYCIIKGPKNYTSGLQSSGIKIDDVNKGQFWNSKSGTYNPAIGYFFLTPDNETYSCGSPGWVKNAFVHLGFSDMDSAAKSLGLEKIKGSDGVSYYKHSGGQTYKDNLEKFRNAVSGYVGNPESAFDAAAQYRQELRAFSAGCLEKTNLGYLKTDALTASQQESEPDKYLYSIEYYDLETRSIVKGVYKGKAHGTNVKYRVNINGDKADNGVAECYNDGGGSLGSLKDSVNSRVKDYQEAYEKYLASGGDQDGFEDEATNSTTTSNSASSCTLQGVGWIVCPVMNFLGDIADGSFAVITHLLSIKSELVASGDSSGTYVAWQYFRDISNVLFVIAFLVIIFSQLTGAGVNNYGVKKILPRLVITAILVNLSFYLCQIAVDISEILGHSLNSFVGETIPGQLNLPQSPPTWAENLGKVLAGVAVSATVIGLAIAGYLAISVPVLLAALLSLVVTLAILVGRQAAVVILIVISPLAFVAYLLPNTEQWFKKWGNMLVGLLLVYPAISLLYGAGKLAGLIIHSANPNDVLMNIVALGATAIPLIATPSLLKGSMNATGTIGAKLSGWASKANNAVGARVKDSSSLGEIGNYRAQQRQIRRAEGRAKTTGVRGVFNRVPNALGGRDYADHVARRGSALADQEFEQSVSDSMAAQKNMTTEGEGDVDGLMQIATGKSLTGAVYSEADRVAAVRTIMKTGSLKQREAIYATSSEAGVSNAAKAAMREGYFARGDHQVFGANLGDQFTLGKVDDSSLEAGLSKQLTEGKISATTLASDNDVADRVKKAVKGLDDTTKAKVAAQARIAMSSPGTGEKLTSAHRDILSEISGNDRAGGLVDQHGNPL